jgi:hypothetical protein
MHRAEPFVPEPSYFEVEVGTEKLKRYESQGIDPIPAELIQAADNTCLKVKSMCIPNYWVSSL